MNSKLTPNPSRATSNKQLLSAESIKIPKCLEATPEKGYLKKFYSRNTGNLSIKHLGRSSFIYEVDNTRFTAS